MPKPENSELPWMTMHDEAGTQYFIVPCTCRKCQRPQLLVTQPPVKPLVSEPLSTEP